MSDKRRAELPSLAVLCSGSGTNLQAIIDACRRGRLRAKVAVVIANREDAYALKRARRLRIPAYFVDRKAYPTLETFEQELIARIQPHAVRLVCLAGFMRVLSPIFVRHFAGRILNIHPALLPSFPGANGVRDALDWGVKVTGVTVHFVDEEIDHGPILLQEPIVIREHETKSRLLKRIHVVEHELYPRAIGYVLEGRVRIAGRRAVVQAKR